jgi:exodeoxyribonuclease VII large subunit
MASSDQLDFTFQAAQMRRIWTVRDLVGAVRTQLEREYTDVWVEGEISNYRPSDAGHLYFTLKDDGAQLRVVMFRLQARLLRFRPENGLRVIARGRVTIYEDRGELQVIAEYLEPKGAGALQVAFEQLKAKLAAEGLFESGRKKPIPPLPRRIGVVTSLRGAAIQDILNILRRRHESVHVLIYPAQVQGETAAGEVSAGVRLFNRPGSLPDKQPVDVIIVSRGGGSIEDLAAFNDEQLARTIAASKVPVVSAVGHETDFTIADFVADLRAPTPSAAAELVIRTKHELSERVTDTRQRLARAVRYRLLMARRDLAERAQERAVGRIRQLINRRQQRLDDLTYRLAMVERERLRKYRRQLEVAGARLSAHDPRRRLSGFRRELAAREGLLNSTIALVLRQRQDRVNSAKARLEALSPQRVLERGYALVFDNAGRLVKDAAQVATGDQIRARLAKGEVKARIE